MNDGGLSKQVIRWEANTAKRRMGRPRKNWIDTVKQDLKEIDMFWEEAQERCAHREDRSRCVNGSSVSLTRDEPRTILL